MTERKKLLAILFVFFMFASMVFTVLKTGGMLKERAENDQRVITGLVSSAISNEFLRPITVAATMSKDANMKRIMAAKTRDEAYKFEEEAGIYLDSIKTGFGYDMIYAVSDYSKVYYTYDGISRFVDDTIDDMDLWYKEFKAAGKDYRLDVDTDIGNDWALSVFVNTAVYDDKRNFMGACGIGMEMQKLQKLLKNYEDIHDIKINLINREGIVQLDTDISKIENSVIEIDNLENYADGECYYEVRPDGNRTISYMKNLEWFLVIQNNNKTDSYLLEMVAPNIICLMLGICCIVIIGRKRRINV